MSRMISELYWPPPSDHAHNSDVDQSDPEERSVTSDIGRCTSSCSSCSAPPPLPDCLLLCVSAVEAAGDAGLQLFVDASVPVDSELIRQLVNEVLAETIALMLGQRDPLGAGPDPALEPAGPADPQEVRKLCRSVVALSPVSEGRRFSSRPNHSHWSPHRNQPHRPARPRPAERLRR